MKKNNEVKIKQRLLEIGIDYLVILVYLLLLLVGMLLFYRFVLGGVPALVNWQSQLLATCSTVIPIIFLFSFLDWYLPSGSIGKKVAGLQLVYQHKSWFRALIRNVIKFLPWQLSHMGIIQGVYDEFASLYALGFTYLGLFLALVLLFMGLFRKDKRHLGDLIAGTQVIQQA